MITETSSITEQERSLLERVRNLLDSGAIKYVPGPRHAPSDNVREAYETGQLSHTETLGFNMDLFISEGWPDDKNDCKTACCIGGWMHLLDPSFVTDERSACLGQLFFPFAIRRWEKITPNIAVRAIDNMLDHGTPDWETLVSKDQLR